MRTTWLIALAAAACATGPAVRVPNPHDALASRQLEKDRETAATLRTIAARARRGESSAIRQEYLERSRSRPWDTMPRLFAAWASAPREEAWQEVAGVARMNPDEPWAFALSGAIYAQWHNFLDQADAAFDRALSLRKGFVPARVGKADVLRLGGKLPEAKAAYEAVLVAAPDWEEAVSGLGLTLVLLKDPAAKPTLEKALQLDPADLAATAALARLAVEAKDADQAIALATKVLQNNPRNREARLSLARMKLEKKDLAGAAVEFEAVLALAPDAATAQALAGLYRELNQDADEARTLEKVALLNPREAEPLVRLAELKKADGDAEGAEAALRRAAERTPGDPVLLLAIARLVRGREDLVGAIEAYRVAKAKGAAEAGPELKQLETKALLPAVPLEGDVNGVYAKISARVTRSYLERLKKGDAPNGKVRARVAIGADGRVTLVEMLEDTLHDQALGALVYFALKDAHYAKVKKTPTFEFVLGAAR